MASGRAKYAIAFLLILGIITASVFASDIVHSINIITIPAPKLSHNQTTSIPSAVFPEVSQPARSITVDLKELKSTYKPPKASIKVGMVVYGPDSDPTIKTLRSVLSQWVSEVNQNGGLFLNSQQTKIPIQVVVYQDSDFEGQGKAYYETLALQDRVDIAVVAGPPSASEAIRVLDENEIFHIALSNIKTDTMVKMNNYTVLLGGGTQNSVGADFGRFAKGLNIKSVAIIRLDDSYYGNVSSTIKRALQLEGIAVVIDDSNTLSGSFFTNAIQNIRQQKPDAVMILATPSVELRFLSSLRQNLASIPLVFTDLAAQSPGRVTTTMGRDVDGLVGYSSWVPSSEFSRRNVNFGPSNEELIKISGLYGNSPQAAQAYAAVKILEKIVQEAGSVNAKEMRTVALKYQGSTTALGPFFVGAEGLTYGNVQIIAQVHRSSDGTISYEIMWPLEYKTSGALYPIPNRFSRP